VDLGAFYLMPFDVVIYSGILYLAVNRYRIVNTALPFYLFIGSLIFQLFNGWSQGIVSNSQVIQKSFFYIGTVTIFSTIDKTSMTTILKKIGPFLFYFLLFVVALEELGVSPLKEFGIINIHGQSFRYFGLHNERLYLTELLLIGGTGLSLTRKINLDLILLIVLSISLLNQSFTGVIQVMLVFLVLKKISFKSMLYFTLIGGFLFFTLNNVHVLFKGIHAVNFSMKIAQYTQSPDESFRFVTNLTIIQEFFRTPTLFGHGMNSNIALVAKVVGKELAATSHSLFYLLHDGGIVGFLFALIFVTYLVVRSRNSSINNESMGLFSVIFSVISLTRMLFYFHPYLPLYYLLAALYAERAKSR
jgi:hypothetical protein